MGGLLSDEVSFVVSEDGLGIFSEDGLGVLSEDGLGILSSDVEVLSVAAEDGLVVGKKEFLVPDSVRGGRVG